MGARSAAAQVAGQRTEPATLGAGRSPGTCLRHGRARVEAAGPGCSLRAALSASPLRPVRPPREAGPAPPEAARPQAR